MAGTLSSHDREICPASPAPFSILSPAAADAQGPGRNLARGLTGLTAVTVTVTPKVVLALDQVKPIESTSYFRDASVARGCDRCDRAVTATVTPNLVQPVP